jgi:hypothetical protein
MRQYLLAGCAALMCGLVFTGCTKKDPPGTTEPAGNGVVKIEFTNKVGSSKLSLNDTWYLNDHGDSFKVSKFNYYISNVKLTKAAGTYVENESYHLIQQSVASSQSFDLADVPYGKYSGITLTIGVDSLRNVSGAQTGALDPANGMFWTWSTGYIMLKLEGTSPKAPSGSISFHAGGFAGANATQRTVSISFPSEITVAKDGVNHVHVEADVLKLFKSPNLYDFANTYNISTAGAAAKGFADNYANMLSVTYAGL